jgi:hypothetical protein
MKKIDYFWLRAAVHITAIVFAVQCVTEVVAARKPEYEWVFWASLCAFAASVLCSVGAVVWNARDKT